MFKTGNSFIFILVLLIASLLVSVFAISCSQLPGTPESTLSLDTPELTPSPSTPGLMPSTNSEESKLIVEDGDDVIGSVAGEKYSEYRLTVDGLVDRPLNLTYEMILQYPSVTNFLVLVCPGLFQERAEWTGVPVKLILEEAGIRPEAEKITFYGSDDYRYTLPLERVEDDSVFLAYGIDGRMMKEEDGGPVRVVAGSELGSAWVRFLVHIEVI